MARADRVDTERRLNRFDELESLDVPIPQIAERMGVHQSVAYVMMKKLRDKYGWQAR